MRSNHYKYTCISAAITYVNAGQERWLSSPQLVEVYCCHGNNVVDSGFTVPGVFFMHLCLYVPVCFCVRSLMLQKPITLLETQIYKTESVFFVSADHIK